MKKIILIIGIVLFLINGLFGFLLSGYEDFNVGFTSCAIAITTILLYLLYSINMRDGFAVGLTVLFMAIGVICYILGLVSEQSVQDNGCVIAAIILTAIEIIALLICNITSKQIKNS